MHPLPAQARSRSTVVIGVLLATLLPTSLRAQSSIEIWGSDYYGQVSGSPGGTGFTRLAAGTRHSVGLRADGSLVSWGFDGGGLVSDTPSEAGFIDVAAGGSSSYALRADGTIVGWGSISISLPTEAGFTQVRSGGGHANALRPDGSIVSWGNDLTGQVTNTPAGMGFTQLAPGIWYSAALHSDGSIVVWGADSYGIISNRPVGTGFIQLVGGPYHVLALRTDGSIVAWGRDDYGEVSSAPTGTRFSHLAAGEHHSMAVAGDGTVVSWGWDYWGQVSNTPIGTGFEQVTAGMLHSLALRAKNSGSEACAGAHFVCPCFAVSVSGEGCPNSTGVGATLVGSGSASLSWPTFELTVAQLPNTVGRFIQGGITGGPDGSFHGEGRLCVSPTKRYRALPITGNSQSRSNLHGFATAGSTIRYQYWYRDSGNSCAGGGWNFSPSWKVSWLP